ncbi:MAG: aldo/keto reductase [Deltaproteobacteria bacterium]|nr:aldo/keto reductase [Deltaproteobacteria bacterium]MBW2725608.1 aldo/keto reductase [Deltaproteobacteria bacterium]
MSASPASQKIGLGTVQFGLDYGIANRRGVAPRGELAAILSIASEAGVRVLDTAPGYGASESLLGELLPKPTPFRLVTKTPVGALGESAEDAARVIVGGLRESLQRLGVDAVYGLLEHRPERLLGEHGDEVFAAMAKLRDAGKTQRVGVSVYSQVQLDAIVARHAIDLVQVPVSVFDQRLLQSGRLKELRGAGIEVHARSTLLQGVVGMSPAALPDFLAGLRSPLGRLAELAGQSRLTPVAAAIAFVHDLPEVDVVLCGVEDQVQLREVLDASQMRVEPRLKAGFQDLAVSDRRLIDPSQWPEKR